MLLCFAFLSSSYLLVRHQWGIAGKASVCCVVQCQQWLKMFTVLVSSWDAQLVTIVFHSLAKTSTICSFPVFKIWFCVIFPFQTYLGPSQIQFVSWICVFIDSWGSLTLSCKEITFGWSPTSSTPLWVPVYISVLWKCCWLFRRKLQFLKLCCLV